MTHSEIESIANKMKASEKEKAAIIKQAKDGNPSAVFALIAMKNRQNG